MKLKISLAEFEETVCMKDQELIKIDELLTGLLAKGPFKFPQRCIKRTSEPNIVEIGNFATCKSDELCLPEIYAKTLLNLTFGYNYVIEEIV